MNIMFNQTGMDTKYKIWHTNGECMIMYVHSGNGSIVSIEKNYSFKKGYLCFIGADKFHYTLPDECENYERSKMFVNKNILDRILSIFPEDMCADKIFTSDALIGVQLTQEYQEEIARVFEDAEQHLNNRAVLTSLYMRLLAYLTEGESSNLPVRSSDIQMAVEYINHHITEDIKVDDICRAINLSKYHFCRKFKSITGCTVMEYISQTRVIIAQNLLKNQMLSITEVSDKCGFSSVSYFCRIFKEQINKTPLQYRRESNNMLD